jgi:hypothetical protein
MYSPERHGATLCACVGGVEDMVIYLFLLIYLFIFILFIYLLFILCIYFSLKSRDSTLDVMTCYGLETLGSNSRKNQAMFLVSKSSNPALGLSHPPIQRVPVFFLGNKAAGA